jgi:ribosome-binding factor A
MTTHRPERIADVIRDILARLLLLEVRDPRIGFVTITGVSLSKDLKHARVFVSMLGEPPDRRAGIIALNHAAPFFRRTLAKEARLRYTPELLFVEDTATERGMRVEAAIREIQREHDAAGQPDEVGAEAPEDD